MKGFCSFVGILIGNLSFLLPVYSALSRVGRVGILCTARLKPFSNSLLALCFIFALLAFNSHAMAQQKQLTNAEAAKIVNQSWENLVVYGFRPGTYTVYVGRDDDFVNGIFAEEMLSELSILFEMGLLHVNIIDQPSKKFSGFQNFMKMPVEGYRATVDVQLTEKGRKFIDKNGAFWISQGSFKVKDIVRNESFRIGVDDYVLVMTTSRANWTPEYLELMRRLSGENLSPDRKSKILYKYDSL